MRAAWMKYSAVIFDLDGVLWDGEPLYHEAFNVVLRPRGHELSAEDYTAIIGNSLEAAWAWVIDRFGITDEPDQLYVLYDRAVIQLMARDIEPLPGARELVGELNRRGVPVGLASASLRNWVDATLAGLGMAGCFKSTVSASEVTRAKPAPDMYLAAAKGIGVAPERCIAVEDTRTGVLSARSAGMYVVQVRAASTALPPIEEADAVINDYAEFDLSLVQ
jgi:HAD superfamily hydrolase (TIGR01509 family)